MSDLTLAQWDDHDARIAVEDALPPGDPVRIVSAFVPVFGDFGRGPENSYEERYTATWADGRTRELDRIRNEWLHLVEGYETIAGADRKLRDVVAEIDAATERDRAAIRNNVLAQGEAA